MWREDGLARDFRAAFLDIAIRLRFDFLAVNTAELSFSSSSSIDVPPGVKEVRRVERDLDFEMRGRIMDGEGSGGQVVSYLSIKMSTMLYGLTEWKSLPTSDIEALGVMTLESPSSWPTLRALRRAAKTGVAILLKEMASIEKQAYTVNL